MLEKFSQIDVTIGDEAFKLYSFKDVYSEFSQHLDHGDGYEEPPLYGILWPSAEGLSWLLWEKYLQRKAAVVDSPIGSGHVILFGIRPQYRAQSYLTFKMLFNSMLYF